MSKPIHQLVKETFEQKGLQAVFRDVLGWDAVSGQEETFATSLAIVRGQKLASLLGVVAVFKFDFSDQTSVPPSFQKEISRAVGVRYAERLIVIETQDSATWLWPKKTSSGTLTHEKLSVPAKSLPLFLAQRLAALRFTAEDHMRGISVQELREKLRGSFDTSTVTKKFYDRFKNEHQELASSIKGLSPEEAGSYATLLLNRLMFIYFLQKKEFLNNDPNYLRTCMRKLQELDHSVNFYNFYRDLLLVLFFEGLNKKEREYKTPQIRTIIGQVPYVNGGIFGETDLEKNNQIEVPDAVFESIFDFFDSFTWHLDTRPTGNADEINPEVIGYIFEQYINFTAGGKKENGAYYTKQDVTGYMVGQTLVPRILDVLVENGINPLAQVPQSKDRYIFDSMLHGWDTEHKAWHAAPERLSQVWLEDPIGWHELDEADLDPIVCLPGESWVETFHRRDRVEKLRIKLSTGEISEVNDLITHNLNGQLLLLDAIQTIDTEDDLRSVWERLSTLSVIDPTCGSGAFLFAALEILEDVYSAIVDVAEELSSRSAFAQQLIDEVEKHPNRRYFIRKKASISNLYGTDLMPDAIETAKLRVFLALASCLDSKDQMEPLPDLDFNFKAGNLIVGIKDLADIDRISEGDLTSQLELRQLEPLIVEYTKKYGEFVKGLIGNDVDSASAKSALAELNKTINAECDQVLARLLFIPQNESQAWVDEKKPFHWFAEFPQVFARGGFDVIAGNPPYIQSTELDKKDLTGYETSKCPDLFAICFERSLSLLENSGRLSLVVMSSLAFSKDFAPLQRLIYGKYDSWSSTYGRIPDGLFTPARVRNTIVILSKGTQTFATRHHVFPKVSRMALFHTLQYFRGNLENSTLLNRGGLVGSLIQEIHLREAPTGAPSGDMYCRGVGGYWFPAMYNQPPVLDAEGFDTGLLDPVIKRVPLRASENKELVVAIMGSKLGYLWWAAIGDDFNASPSQTLGPRSLVATLIDDHEVKLLVKKISEMAKFHLFTTQNAKASYVNLRWPALNELTDKLVIRVLALAGMPDQWRALNIAYRQQMRSSGDSVRARPVTAEVARQFDLLGA